MYWSTNWSKEVEIDIEMENPIFASLLNVWVTWLECETMESDNVILIDDTFYVLTIDSCDCDQWSGY